jgi:SPP1 gp7 family putative phage head morphogenesis protein
MPVHEVSPGRWRWGKSGKTYGSKELAERQARAIFASGWREDKKRRRLAHNALSVSRQAETAYVLALVRIIGQVHAGVLHVVRRERLGLPDAPPVERQNGGRRASARKAASIAVEKGEAIRQDAPPVGLGDDLLRRMFRYVKPQTQEAFDRMAKEVSAKADPAMRAVLEHDLARRIAERQAVRPIALPGRMQAIVERARDRNVNLITRASRVFLDQVKGVLRDNSGAHPETLAKLLEERVGVSRSRAVLIARDQVGKLHGQIIRHRQVEAGIKRFTWSTSRDERVRPSHAELEGKDFSWDDDIREDEMQDYDIADDDPDDPAPVPGSAIQCRCTALPVLEEAEGEGEEEGEEGEEEEEPEGGEEEGERAGFAAGLGAGAAAAEELGPEEEEPEEEGPDPDDIDDVTEQAEEAGVDLDPDEAAELAEEDVDWNAIAELLDRAASAAADGPIPRGLWETLWAEGVAAAGGRLEALRGLERFRPI